MRHSIEFSKGGQITKRSSLTTTVRAADELRRHKAEPQHARNVNRPASRLPRCRLTIIGFRSLPVFHDWVAGLCTPGHPCSLSGVSVRVFSAVQPLLEPIQHFGLNPSHSVGADLYPLREHPGLFQSGHVLWRVQDHLLELALRKYPHHDASVSEEHRDAQGYDNPRGGQIISVGEPIDQFPVATRAPHSLDEHTIASERVGPTGV